VSPRISVPAKTLLPLIKRSRRHPHHLAEFGDSHPAFHMRINSLAPQPLSISQLSGHRQPRFRIMESKATQITARAYNGFLGRLQYLFEIIMRRHELKSTLMTSNRPLEDWGKLIGDVPAATAILDRFLQQAEVLEITGRSYRLRNGVRSATDSDGRANSKPKAQTSKSNREQSAT
jgi:hypothetical protein